MFSAIYSAYWIEKVIATKLQMRFTFCFHCFSYSTVLFTVTMLFCKKNKSQKSQINVEIKEYNILRCVRYTLKAIKSRNIDVPTLCIKWSWMWISMQQRVTIRCSQNSDTSTTHTIKAHNISLKSYSSHTQLLLLLLLLCEYENKMNGKLQIVMCAVACLFAHSLVSRYKISFKVGTNGEQC